MVSIPGSAHLKMLVFLTRRFPLGNGTRATFNSLNSIKDAQSERPFFQLMDQDEYLKTKIEKMRAVSTRGDILRAVKKEVGLAV